MFTLSEYKVVETLVQAKPAYYARVCKRQGIDPLTLSDGFVKAIGQAAYELLVREYNVLTGRK